MFIVTNRKFFYALSIILCVASLVALFAWGLLPGIDFKGGSIVEVEYGSTALATGATSTRPSLEVVKSHLETLDIGDISVRETGESGLILRSKDLSLEEHTALLEVLAESGDATEKRFDSVGPILGKEALQKSWVSVGLVLLAIILFITFAFRHVSKPVSSFKYGLIAIIGLIHNILITAGVFAFLGHFRAVEVDTLFVTALLVILGFSIHDTIVVFDRVRENLRLSGEGKNRKAFDIIVGDSIGQTFVRSINTSLTTLIAIFVLYLIGAEATRHFSLALLVGIAAGTYSSIFLCSPLLVSVYKWQEKRA
jgi:preprotein translocase subunit SecF